MQQMYALPLSNLCKNVKKDGRGNQGEIFAIIIRIFV